MKEEEFNKLCRLSRLSLNDEEKGKLLKNLKDILDYIEQLEEVNTEGVPICYTVHETLKNVVREDIPETPMSRDLFLADAPSHTGGMIRVPPVLKQ